MATTVLDVLSEKIESEAQRVSDYLASGKADDFADYQFMCGQIRGLMAAQVFLDDLTQEYLNDD